MAFGHSWYLTIQNSKYDLTLDHDVWDFTMFPGQECRIEKKYGVLPLVVKPHICFQSYTPDNFFAKYQHISHQLSKLEIYKRYITHLAFCCQKIAKLVIFHQKNTKLAGWGLIWQYLPNNYYECRIEKKYGLLPLVVFTQYFFSILHS